MRHTNGRDRNGRRGLAATLLALGLLCACRSGAVGSPPPSASAPIAADVPSGPPRLLAGTLVDSLFTSDVLRGALLSLDGVLRVTSTSDKGEFQFDSVAPGAHHLVVRHPLLDSLGIDTIGVDLRLGSTPNRLTVALPTATTFMAARCGPPSKGSISDGMLLGVVRRAETDEPVAGIEVAAAWRGRDTTYFGGGLRERARVRTTADGQYLICRVPRFTPVELTTRVAGGRPGTRVRLQLGQAVLGAFDLSTAERPGDSTTIADAGFGSITGRIVSSSGDELPNVTVLLDRPAVRTTTDATGTFTFPRVAPGLRAIDVRAIGFRPSRIGVNIRPGQRISRAITIDRNMAMLGTVIVRGSRPATWDSLGFLERQRRGGGYFLTRETLKGVADLTTALRLVPGVSGKTDLQRSGIRAGRGAGCFPAYVVNGVPFGANSNIGPESFIRAEDIRGVEVYTSKLTTPPEYQRYLDCSVIVIWLRDRQGEIEAAKRRTTP